jgi:hypothetical protein
MAVSSVEDGRREDLFQRHRSIVSQQEKERVERARNARHQEARARNEIETEVSIIGDRGAARGRALAAYHLGTAALCVVKHDRSVAAGTVQMRLDYLERKRGGNRGIERVAAAFKHSHPNRARDPVGCRHDANVPWIPGLVVKRFGLMKPMTTRPASLRSAESADDRGSVIPHSRPTAEISGSEARLSHHSLNSIAVTMSAAASFSLRCSSIIDAGQIWPMGLAIPCPAVSGADPWTASNKDAEVRRRTLEPGRRQLAS